MFEIIEYLGPTPCDEDSAQTTDSDFANANLTENRRFKMLLEAAFPPPKGCVLRIKAERHEFGIYREVVASIDNKNPPEEHDLDNWIAQLTSVGSWAELEALQPNHETTKAMAA